MIKRALKNLFSIKGTSFRHALALLATGLLATAIGYLTLFPQQPSASGGLLSDKAYHFVAFAALIFPTAVFYARSLFWVLPAAAMFGGMIELIQPYVGRSGETADFIADILGVVFGLVIGLLIRAAHRSRARLKLTEAA